MNRTASILALLIGVMSIVAGGKAMRGWNPGYSVLAWLPVYNFIMGILTIIPAVMIWNHNRHAMTVSLAVFGIHAVVLLLLLFVFRGTVAFQSIGAMIFRLLVWLSILALLFFQSRKT